MVIAASLDGSKTSIPGNVLHVIQSAPHALDPFSTIVYHAPRPILSRFKSKVKDVAYSPVLHHPSIGTRTRCHASLATRLARPVLGLVLNNVYHVRGPSRWPRDHANSLETTQFVPALTFPYFTKSIAGNMFCTKKSYSKQRCLFQILCPKNTPKICSKRHCKVLIPDYKQWPRAEHVNEVFHKKHRHDMKAGAELRTSIGKKYPREADPSMEENATSRARPDRPEVPDTICTIDDNGLWF